MSLEYENLVKSGESQDLGIAIQNLINDNIKALRTNFLAKVTNIENNRISFVKLIKDKEKEAIVTLNNVMVGFPYSQKWQIQHKLAIGDIGLVFVLENDITTYKTSGSGGVVTNRRYKDINDCIFIPLSMYQSRNNQDINYIIESDTKKCKLEFNNDEIGIFKAKLLTLESENTTLKAKLIELANLLEGLASGSTSVVSAHSHQTAPDSIGRFSSWANSLNQLFKD